MHYSALTIKGNKTSNFINDYETFTFVHLVPIPPVQSLINWRGSRAVEVEPKHFSETPAILQSPPSRLLLPACSPPSAPQLACKIEKGKRTSSPDYMARGRDNGSSRIFFSHRNWNRMFGDILLNWPGWYVSLIATVFLSDMNLQIKREKYKCLLQNLVFPHPWCNISDCFYCESCGGGKVG